MKIASAFMTALMIFALGLTAFADAADAGKRSRRNAAIGIGLGVAALAIIAANSNKARARDYDDDDDGYRSRRYRSSGGGNSCARLLRKCNNGNDWACEKYETGGCTE